MIWYNNINWCFILDWEGCVKKAKKKIKKIDKKQLKKIKGGVAQVDNNEIKQRGNGIRNERPVNGGAAAAGRDGRAV